jgi:peptidyl-prolyl cis-trans isomerase C
MERSLFTLLLCLYVIATTFAFQPTGAFISTHQWTLSPAIVHPSLTTTTRQCQLFGGFLDDVGNFMKRFTTKATASHILIKGGAEAENKLEDLKIEIGDSPIKFAEAAAQYSECSSASSGGNLGEFGPGAMVKEFDEVVFKEQVGKVHGPVKTQFGYHLIYINERTE